MGTNVLILITHLLCSHLFFCPSALALCSAAHESCCYIYFKNAPPPPSHVSAQVLAKRAAANTCCLDQTESEDGEVASRPNLQVSSG